MCPSCVCVYVCVNTLWLECVYVFVSVCVSCCPWARARPTAAVTARAPRPATALSGVPTHTYLSQGGDRAAEAPAQTARMTQHVFGEPRALQLSQHSTGNSANTRRKQSGTYHHEAERGVRQWNVPLSCHS